MLAAAGGLLFGPQHSCCPRMTHEYAVQHNSPGQLE
jgi:hypothetical protein